MSAVPYKVPRIVSLALTVAFGVIGMGVGINALVKSNDQKDDLRKAATAMGATANINTDDVLHSGIVLTVASGLLALVAFLSLVPLLLSSGLARRSGSLKLQAGLLGFLSVWLFATLIPFTTFFANRQAKVSAFIGDFELPEIAIQAVEKSLGASPVYKEIDYLRLSAILPWFAFLFGLISAILSFLASRHVTSYPPHPASIADEKNEARISQQEV